MNKACDLINDILILNKQIEKDLVILRSILPTKLTDEQDALIAELIIHLKNKRRT
jgi:hypothetical protein